MNNIIDANEEITVKEASDISNKKYIRIIRAINNKKIPATKTKKSYIMKYGDFEKWWKEIQKEDDLKIENINNNKELLEEFSKTDIEKSKHKYGYVIPFCAPLQKRDFPQESDFKNKDLKYICKSLQITANSFVSLEITSLVRAFRPSNLAIKVISDKIMAKEFIEICNVTVMGDPQLTNFNGLTDASMRGSSLIFENGLDISNWSIFGASPGQGLVIDFANPHNFDIKVELLLSGWETKSDYLGMLVDTNKNKILFAKIKCDPNKITKTNILAGRRSAFKANNLQINHFSESGNYYAVTNLNNVSVLNKQQFDYLDENNISTTHFEKMKPVNFDAFSEIKGKGLDISFHNKSEYEVINYITLLGEPVDSDLVGTK